jgi:hypothetical protein
MRRMMTLGFLFLAAGAFAAERPVTAADAHALFARFQSMAGSWHAKSSKGWTETAKFEVAGKGSVVYERSFFDDEPNDGMLSAIYLDGDQLLLTHYCEAGNQPTLVAATIDEEHHRVSFRFLRGTNLAARPGHMHAVDFTFVDDDHVRSRWSFFSKGQEQWFEEVEQVRTR